MTNSSEQSQTSRTSNPVDLLRRIQLSIDGFARGESVSTWVNNELLKEATAEIERLTRGMNGQAEVMVAREREFAAALLRIEELERANVGLATESERRRAALERCQIEAARCPTGCPQCVKIIDIAYEAKRGSPSETAGEPAPTAVRFTFDAGRMEPVLEWTRMPSGAYVVLAGTADNFDSLWFDREGRHPKSELIFASLIPQPTQATTEAMLARTRSAQKAPETSERPAHPLDGYCPGKRYIRSKLFQQFLEQDFWHAHHVDLVWRYNGEDVHEEADWLKDVWYALRDPSEKAPETSGKPVFVSTKKMLAELIAGLEEIATNSPMSAGTRSRLRGLIAESSHLLTDAADRASEKASGESHGG